MRSILELSPESLKQSRTLRVPFIFTSTVSCGFFHESATELCADSESSIEDVIFERRFGCAEGFCRLGAQAETAGRVLTIAPGGHLCGTVVEAPDLRGGAALVLAGLAARGTTVITHPAHIDRGYAGFTEILAGLGAQIRRESAPGNGSVKKTSAKKQICLAIGTKR